MKKKCYALILAGGYSERMNFPKAFLDYKGKTFLHSLAELYYKAGIKNIVAVMNSNYCKDEWRRFIKPVSRYCTVIKNNHPEKGRFHSIKLGINKMKGAGYCFIQNVDNPFVSKEIVSLLLDNRMDNGYSVPVFSQKGGHPVLVSKRIIEKINSSPDKDLNLRKMLDDFERNEVQVNDKRVLWNINTMADYKKYITLNNTKPA